ncbi:GxxExxY protein [candidate division KSB1 bacterium]|nr:GxxExxY protein [candidate division KSB1 bacterium]
MESDYLYKDLNYQINGCAFDAFKEVGVGFDEPRYHKFFHQHLLDKGLKAKYKAPLQAFYRNHKIADFEADEIVEDCIVVEAKAIQTDFIPENYAQLFTYLRLTKLKLGLLVNFGLIKAKSKRVIFDEIRMDSTESWDDEFFLHFSRKPSLDLVLNSIHAVDQELGPGFHSKLYKAALKIELGEKQISYDENVLIPLESERVQVDPMESDFWMVDGAFLLAILAGKGEMRKYDIYRMRSYLKHLKFNHGLIAYWNVNNLQLYGIYQP